MKLSASFTDHVAAGRVLSCWRRDGVQGALSSLANEYSRCAPGPLLMELSSRLHCESGPRLLVDCLWLSRAHGGITRVWNQIFSTWNLPGLISPMSPIALIKRDGCVSINNNFPSFKGHAVDPLDFSEVFRCSAENAAYVSEWSADVFCSTWISSSAPSSPACSEVALLHDFLPERFRPRDASLLPLRRRWWGQASALLAVSADSAADVSSHLLGSDCCVDWCHPAPDPVFSESVRQHDSELFWDSLRDRAGLSSNYVVLPATSAIGSYKNPELVAMALSDPRLQSLQLVLCGIAAEQRAKEIEDRFPHLRDRILAAGFKDPELAMVYCHALAVLIPSRIEGFGLPAIEVMASGGLPLVADSRGLREAGAEAAIRFDPDCPEQLIGVLQLLSDPASRFWLRGLLQSRVEARLARLNPDLIGLSLLALARRVSA